MNARISIADLVMVAGALVTLLFSFFGFYEFGPISVSAWDTDALAFVSTIPVLLALASIVWIVCEVLGVNLPQNLLTYNPQQVKGTWGIAAAGIMLAFVTTSGDKSAFFWLQLLGSIAMAVGAVMALLGKGTETVGIPASGSTTESAPEGQAPPPSPPPQQQPPQQPPPPPSAAPTSSPAPPPPAPPSAPSN